MLKIDNLRVSVDNKEVVKGVSLEIKPGEIHALMGPNGSGKSSLAMSLAGHPHYVIASSPSESEDDVAISLDGISLIDKTPDERARMGLFLASQYPAGVGGVTVEQLLRRAAQEKDEKDAILPVLEGSHPSRLDVLKFRKDLEKMAEKIGVNKELLHRSINVGFSGGEKKRLEILQMLVMQPKYAILDETDSGLDIDGLKIVARMVKMAEWFDGYKPGILVITHYARLLHYLKPDFVHIMKNGKIIETGGKEVAIRVEKEGYRNNEEK